jgi:hypothetical protein
MAELVAAGDIDGNGGSIDYEQFLAAMIDSDR